MVQTSSSTWRDRALYAALAFPCVALLTGGCAILSLIQPATPEDLQLVSVRKIKATPMIRIFDQALQKPVQITFDSSTKLSAFVRSYSGFSPWSAYCGQWNQTFRKELEPLAVTSVYYQQLEFDGHTDAEPEETAVNGRYQYAIYLDSAKYPDLGKGDICFSLQGEGEFYGPYFETNIVTIPAAALAEALAKAPE